MQILEGVYGSEHKQSNIEVTKVCECVQAVGCARRLLVLEFMGPDAEGRRIINLSGLWFRMKG